MEVFPEPATEESREACAQDLSATIAIQTHDLLHMGVTDQGIVPGIEAMPEGFRIAFPVFWIEDDYFINGWTALTNAGEWLLPSAIAAYERIGMVPEANALRAALEAFRTDPGNDLAVEAAYQSVENPYSDDEIKHSALLSFFRANSHLFVVRTDG